MAGKQDAIGTDIAAALVKNLERIDPKALVDDDSSEGTSVLVFRTDRKSTNHWV